MTQISRLDRVPQRVHFTGLFLSVNCELERQSFVSLNYLKALQTASFSLIAFTPAQGKQPRPGREQSHDGSTPSLGTLNFLIEEL